MNTNLRVHARRSALGLVVLLGGSAAFAVGCSSSPGEDGASASTSSTDNQALTSPGTLSSAEILGSITCGATKTAAYSGTPKYLAYSFSGHVGEIANLIATASAGTADVWLLRSDFSQVTSLSGTPTANIIATLSATETYYLAFKRGSGLPTSFSLALECSGDVPDAGAGGGDAGACGTTCASGQSCVSGQCEYTSCTGIQVPGDYATIQDALAVVPNGGTICLGAQTYPENLSVTSTGPIVLQGISSGLTSVTSIAATAGSQVSLKGISSVSATLAGTGDVEGSSLNYLSLGGTSTVSASAADLLTIAGSATVTHSTANALDVATSSGTTANVVLNGVEVLNGGATSVGSSGSLSFTLENSYLTGPFAVNGGAVPNGGSISLLNNTIVGPGSTTGTGVYLTGSSTTALTYFNNIVTNFDLGIDIEGSVGPVSFGNNALYGLTTRYGGSAVVGTGYVLTNPDLSTSTPPALAAGSPCLDAGSAAHAPATDFWGNARSASIVDIGAVAGPAGSPLPLPPTEVSSSYSQSFTSGATPTTQCTAWTTFQAGLTGTYSLVTINGSNGSTGLSCSGSAANTICQAVHTGTATSVSCEGHTWTTGTCGSGLELNVDQSVCACTTGYTVRPCIGDDNWGGINTTSCAAPSQTLSVICE